MHNFGIDPYEGDLFHETPIGLFVFNLVQKYLPQWALFLLFVVSDLATALCLIITARHYAIETVSTEANFLIMKSNLLHVFIKEIMSLYLF